MAEYLSRFRAPPSTCGYLPEQRWSLEYEYVLSLSPSEYLERMLDGWRRFGHMLFHPACPSCTACRPARILVDEFQPDRSQRRVRKTNETEVRLEIHSPSVTRTKLALYDRYHAFQADAKDWPRHPPKDAETYADSFVHQPFEVEEWNYFLGDRLIGVGYVDYLPTLRASVLGHPALTPSTQRAQGGLSAIYFFWDPQEASRSLGTWNVLRLIDEARNRGLPFVYLGYYVEGCASMAYKIRFLPIEIREQDGQWYRMNRK